MCILLLLLLLLLLLACDAFVRTNRHTIAIIFLDIMVLTLHLNILKFYPHILDFFTLS